MNTVMILFSSFFASVVVIMLAFFYIPLFVGYFKRKTVTDMKPEQFQAVLNNFLTGSNKSGEVGKDFVKLVNYGYIQCSKTGNHGRDFPDKKQYDSFMRYATIEIAAALKEIGDSVC